MWVLNWAFPAIVLFWLKKMRRKNEKSLMKLNFIHFGIVWKHLLLKFCASSALFLQTLPGQSLGIQTEKQKKQGNFVDMSGRFVSFFYCCLSIKLTNPLDIFMKIFQVLFNCNSKEESWFDSTEKVHRSSKKRKRGIWQLHAARWINFQLIDNPV